MSKPIPRDGIVFRSSEDQLRYFAGLYRTSLNPAQEAWFRVRSAGLGLSYANDEAAVIAALDTPAKVQEFLNTEIHYNNDHATANQEETAMPLRRVLQTGLAHCFEGALFAYAVNYLHGHNPCLVLLEASQDADHNLVVWRDPRTKRYGSNAHSRYPYLDGRPADFATLRELAESYVPYYYSDRTSDPRDLSLVGFSDPIDLVAKYGVTWMASEDPLWDIYYTYIDETRRFHYFADDPGEPHLYPLIRALKEHWIRIDEPGKPRVSVTDLPRAAQDCWQAFWREYNPNEGPLPRGEAHDIEKEFRRLTGTTPIDLDDNAFDFQFYLAAGCRVDQLLAPR